MHMDPKKIVLNAVSVERNDRRTMFSFARERKKCSTLSASREMIGGGVDTHEDLAKLCSTLSASREMIGDSRE